MDVCRHADGGVGREGCLRLAARTQGPFRWSVFVGRFASSRSLTFTALFCFQGYNVPNPRLSITGLFSTVSHGRSGFLITQTHSVRWSQDIRRSSPLCARFCAEDSWTPLGQSTPHPKSQGRSHKPHRWTPISQVLLLVVLFALPLTTPEGCFFWCSYFLEMNSLWKCIFFS